MPWVQSQLHLFGGYAINNFDWDAFFNDWETEFGFDIFCRDGIVDPSLYFSDAVPHKVLFVLKDVHIPNKTKAAIRAEKRVVDMRKEIFLSGEGKTWNPIALWAKALTEKIPVSFENVGNGIALRKDAMPKVAFMNIKKEAGNASVSGESVRQYAREQRLKLIEEVKACDPDIVIACSKNDVFNVLRCEVFNLPNNNKLSRIELNEKASNLGHFFDISSYIGKSSPVYLVEYRHPSRCGQQGTNEEHYENMLKIRQFLFGE